MERTITKELTLRATHDGEVVVISAMLRGIKGDLRLSPQTAILLAAELIAAASNTGWNVRDSLSRN